MSLPITQLRGSVSAPNLQSANLHALERDSTHSTGSMGVDSNASGMLLLHTQTQTQAPATITHHTGMLVMLVVIVLYIMCVDMLGIIFIIVTHVEQQMHANQENNITPTNTIMKNITPTNILAGPGSESDGEFPSLEQAVVKGTDMEVDDSTPFELKALEVVLDYVRG